LIVTSIARVILLVAVALVILPMLSPLVEAGNCGTCAPYAACGACPPLCEAPVTKSYKMQPGFCATTVACMIPNCVEPDGSCDCCAPYGIPPVYASGNYVLVRQTVEGQKRVAEFLTQLKAYVPPAAPTTQ
jgi:hypothetical protein